MTLRVPLLAEQLEIDKRRVETGRVRVRTQVREVEAEAGGMALHSDHVHVERVAVGRAVDQPQAVRQEGDVTIVPVHEEVLVVTRQLMLKEELHIHRRSEVHRQPSQPVLLRREEATIERIEPAAPDDGPRRRPRAPSHPNAADPRQHDKGKPKP